MIKCILVLASLSLSLTASAETLNCKAAGNAAEYSFSINLNENYSRITSPINVANMISGNHYFTSKHKRLDMTDMSPFFVHLIHRKTKKQHFNFSRHPEPSNHLAIYEGKSFYSPSGFNYNANIYDCTKKTRRGHCLRVHLHCD